MRLTLMQSTLEANVHCLQFYKWSWHHMFGLGNAILKTFDVILLSSLLPNNRSCIGIYLTLTQQHVEFYTCK